MILAVIGIFAYFIIGYSYLSDVFKRDRFNYDEIKKELGDIGDMEHVDRLLVLIWPLFLISDITQFIKDKFERK